MRLLEKHELDQQKAQERKREIDEGAKLAKKVDELRKLEAQERANLTAWRNATLEDIKREIDASIRERDGLKDTVARLRDEQAKLRVPLDKEWENIKAEKESLGTLKQDLHLQEASLASRQNTLGKSERENEIEKGRIADFKHMASQKLAQAEQSLTVAHEEAADMRNKAQAMLSMSEVRAHEIDSRELTVAARERDVDNQRQFNEKEALRLTIERRRLQDLAKTLERASQRIYG